MGQTGSCQLAILISIGCAASLFARGARPAAFVAQVASGGPNLSGTWTLDSYLSDNPEQVARELRFDTGQSSLEESREPMEGERYGGRGMGRGGFGRGGFGRSGTGESGRARADQIGAEDRKLLKELTDAVQFPPPTLTISQTGNDITLAGESGVTQTLHGSGKSERQQLDAGSVDRTASWEGPQLVVRYQIGHAGTLRYTYSLVPATKQLLVRVNFERGQQPGPFEIKLVYDPAPSGGTRNVK